jgi:hypothetical protein
LIGLRGRVSKNQGSDGSSTRATEVKKLFIHARKSASFGGMYLVIRHHLANGFRRPCVFSCQMAIDSHQTTMDSHQTTIDSYQTTMDRRQVNRTAGECSSARRMVRMSHKVEARRAVPPRLISRVGMRGIYCLLRRRSSSPTSPAPSASRLAGSGTVSSRKASPRPVAALKPYPTI